MKLSNFKITKEIGKGPLDWEWFATVDVKTGFWPFTKTENRMIHRKYAGFWRFVDSGKHTPFYQAEDLFASWKAQKKLKAEA